MIFNCFACKVNYSILILSGCIFFTIVLLFLYTFSSEKKNTSLEFWILSLWFNTYSFAAELLVFNINSYEQTIIYFSFFIVFPG